MGVTFLLQCIELCVVADHVSARYRGVWPVTKTGEDTSGSRVRGTLPACSHAL